MAVTPDIGQINPFFLFFLFMEKNISEFAQPGNPPSMRKGDVEGWMIPVPPSDLQLKFAGRISKIGELRKAQRLHAQKINMLFSSLQHGAFTGELSASSTATQDKLRLAG